MIDWLKIKNEYIFTNISQRDLAKKYNVSFDTLKDRANREKWKALRDENHNKIAIKLQQEIETAIIDTEIDRMQRLYNVADKLLSKIEEAVEQLDQYVIETKTKKETIEYETEEAGYGKPKIKNIEETEDKQVVKKDFLDRLGIKQLASALKDIKDIQINIMDDDEDMDDGFVEAITNEVEKIEWQG